MADFLKCYSLILLLINIHCVALASAYQVERPSEYVYKSDSVTRSEESEANCRMYPPNSEDGGIHYTHCDGTQLKLTDSDFGSEQYSSSDYYVWNAGSSRQLLFIFATRVNLTTITLHYYSDNTKGLPRLRFFALPDDFEIWDAVTASISKPVDIAAVPPDRESAGLRNVSVNLDFMNVKKVLLYKFSSTILAASEVEFFSYKTTENRMGATTTQSSSATTQTTTYFSLRTFRINSEKQPITETMNPPNATDSNKIIITLNENRAATGDKSTDSGVAIGTGIAIAIAMILLLTVIASIALVLMRKSAQKRKADYDSSYSTLCRESGQQMQSQSLHTSNDLYDQIQLSPSTGQAEFISRNETANTNNSPPHQTEYGIHPSVDKDKPKSAKLKITASTMSTQDEEKSTSEQPTYAVVNKKKKQKIENVPVHCKTQNIAEASQNEGVTEQNVVKQGSHDQESSDTTMQFSSQTIDSPQELYTAVKKKPKDRPVEDEIAPPIPPYTTEELYTAVKKKPKASAAGNEQAPQIPPYAFEELYTAVQKKPKTTTTNYEEQAPPIPAHTVEELYTAVMKKPKVRTAEDEEEAPPVPPYTVEEL